MDSKESEPPNWKTCFKKILAPHLLNPADMKEPNDANVRNVSHGERQNNAHFNIGNPKNDSNTISFPYDIEKSEDAQKNITPSNSAEAVHITDRSRSFIDAFCRRRDSGSPERKLDEDLVETDEGIAQIIADDAEELAKNFKKLKIKKKHINMAQSSRNPPEWKNAFKKVLDPAYASENSTENSLKIISPEELRNEAMKRIEVVQAGGPIDTEFYELHPELLESIETSPWPYKILTRDYKPLGNKELGDSNNKLTGLQTKKKDKKFKRKKHLSKEEQKVLEILKSAQCFRLPKTPHCFDDSDKESSSPEEPKYVPPTGGVVCVKPWSIEDEKNRPPDPIPSEYWDAEFFEEW